MRKSIRENVADVLGVPKETVMDLTKLELAGNRELYLENYKNIVEYTGQLIRVRTADGFLKITGEKLHISSMDLDGLFVQGYFRSVEFEQQ